MAGGWAATPLVFHWRDYCGEREGGDVKQSREEMLVSDIREEVVEGLYLVVC